MTSAIELPDPGVGFRWQAEAWGPLLTCDALSVVARHGFTTRQLGLRPGEGSGERWTAAATSVGCTVGRVARVRQVHGAAVRVVTADALTDPVPEADAAVTREAGVAVAVVAADCVPILLADARTGAVGAVHAGWRGTTANAAGAAVATLTREFGVDPGSLVAVVGPSIGPCCYTVGPELVSAFLRAGHPRSAVERWFAERDGRWVLDLWTANRDLLTAAGLDGANVHVAGLCTQTHREVFESFRVDGEGAGRMAAIVVAP
jgi:polyphenol oxidase